MGGVIGSLQAMEAIKYLVGAGNLLVYDSSAEYLILSLKNRKRPMLKAFGISGGKNVTIHEMIIAQEQNL